MKHYTPILSYNFTFDLLTHAINLHKISNSKLDKKLLLTFCK